jgi:hypothetical protein
MGCFNVACGVSRISMGGGEPVVLIPLVDADDKITEKYEGAFIVTNEGPKGTFVPFTLPIFGDYDDYGSIENIQRDCNVETIEKFFNCKIEVFQNAVCRPFDGDKIDSDKMPKKPLGMLVHRAVYDWLVNAPMSEFGGKPTTAYDSVYVSAYVLRLIGFVEGEKKDDRQRYNRPFTHPEIPKLTVWSDGTWIEIEIDERKVNSWIYNPEDLAQFLVEHSLPVPPIIESFKNRSYYDVEYDRELEKMTKSVDMRKRIVEALTKLGKAESAESIALMINDMTTMYDIFRFGSRYSNTDRFYEMYSHLFSDKSFKDLVVKFKTFECGLGAVNAPYMPSWNGYQCGNHYATLGLAKLVLDITQNKIKEKEES